MTQLLGSWALKFGVNRLYQGKNNNPPDVPVLMHYHINQVHANNQNIFPGIVSVTAFVSALPSLAYS